MYVLRLMRLPLIEMLGGKCMHDNIKTRKKLTVMDTYTNRVFYIGMLIAPSACQCAGLTYTLLKILGYFPMIPWMEMITFDLSCLLYLLTGIYFVKTGIGIDGVVIPKKLNYGKIYLVLIMFTQFNFILYMVPSEDFWGFAFFFVILTAFFIDVRMVVACSIEISISLVVSWIFRGNVLLPVQDEYFVPNFVNRTVCVILSLPTLCLLVYLVEHYLVTAKNEEIKENNAQMEQMLKNEIEQKNMIEEALAIAKQANQAKTLFLANMSHDIRTPMNAIIGFSAIAAGQIDDKERVEDCIDKIQIAGNHLLGLINDILDMSRIESGKVALQEEEDNISDIIHDTVNMIQNQMKEKKINFQVDVHEITNEFIIVDAMKLNRIFNNILGNAMKFTPEGKSVTFSIRQKKEAPNGFGSYEFCIKDTGIGMSEEFIKKIFEPFEREQSVTQTKIEGTGLGMAITKNLVDMMGGVITVHSKKGEGTEFVIDMPLRLSQRKEVMEDSVVFKDLRLLVIDDELDYIENITFMLDQLGVSADWTTSAKDAVLRAKKSEKMGKPYEVYIVDMLMPDMDGLETIKQLRSEIGDDVPIILLSAYDLVDIEQEAKKTGVTCFCTKPLFKSDLVRVLKKTRVCNAGMIEQEEKSIQVQNLNGKHVLLVEDTLLNQKLAIMVLEERGAKVTLAQDGKEAVEIFGKSGEGTYDLILMDIMMPKMDGYQATRIIRAMDRQDAKQIPIIAMTANAFDEDKRSSVEAGMNAHISKPFKNDTLDKVLGSYIK